MMSSTKSQDGYSKILTKSDCDKLKGLGKRKDVDYCEHLGNKIYRLWMFACVFHHMLRNINTFGF